MSIITVTSTFVDLEMGFWGLVSDDGTQYLPIQFPEQLKKEGMKSSISYKETEVMGFSMWGTAIEIISFTT